MAIAVYLVDPIPVPAQAVCSVGRWLSHDTWPGWQEPCPEPGTELLTEPYVICRMHKAEAAAWEAAQP